MAKNFQLRYWGFDTLERRLMLLMLHNVVEPAEVVVKNTVEDVGHIAREFAPEDTGTLVGAMEVSPHRRNGFYVSSELIVDPDRYNQKYHKRVGEYSDYINENLTPYGARLKLGPRSALKQPTVDDGIGVGGHFTQRALACCVDAFLADLRSAINKKLNDLK